MKCPEISDLHFSPEGKKAINRIADIQELGDLLATVLGGSAVVSLFASRGTGNKRVDTGMTMHSVSGYDWHLWAQAMAAAGKTKRAQIEKTAKEMLIDTTKISPNERKFWEAVYEGCGR